MQILVRLKHSAILLLLATLIPSCSTLPKYTEPTNQPQAKVRFILTNPDKYYGHLNIVNLETCKISSAIGWLNGGKETDLNRIGMLESSPPKDGIVERKVIAGEQLTVIPTFLLPTWKWVYLLKAAESTFKSAQPGVCKAPIFIPEVNSQYEYLITPGPGACEIAIRTIKVSSSGQVIREELNLSQSKFISVGSPDIGCPK